MARNEKPLGADAAAVVTAGSIDTPAASHAGWRAMVSLGDGSWSVWSRDKRVAKVYNGGYSSDVAEANALLIAAAPELLETLKDVLATGLNGGNNVRLAFIAASRDALDDDSLAQADRSEAAVQKALAVIAKAEGR